MNRSYRDAAPAIVGPDATIRRALEAIHRGGAGIAIIQPSDGPMEGIVTDSDVRQGLIAGHSPESPVGPLVNRKPFTAREDATKSDLLNQLRRCNVPQLPLLDARGRVVAIAMLSELVREPHESGTAVVLAGGRGERLGPLTLNTPKPLLPLRDAPILEGILLQLVVSGFSDVYLSVNYLAEKFEEHFGDGKGFGINVHYLKEEKRLGTAGCLQLLPSSAKPPFLVINGDIVSRIHYGYMLDYHAASGADATIGVVPRSATIPYGVAEIGDSREIVAIREKPTFNFQIVGGIYILSERFLSLIPKGDGIDMPDLLRKAIEAKWKVHPFLIHEEWYDIGHPFDYMRVKDKGF